MNVEQVREEQLRLSELYNQIEKMHDDDALDNDILHTKKALEEGYLPDSFEEELTEYLEILNLVKKDRGIQDKKIR